MTDQNGPGLGEVSRNVASLAKDVREGFRDVRAEMSERFDKVPTNDVLLAVLASRDAEVKALRERIDAEESDRKDEDRRLERTIENLRDDATAGKRWAIGVAISAAVLFLGVIGFILDIGGGPT